MVGKHCADRNSRLIVSTGNGSLGQTVERDELERLVGGRLRLSFEEILNHALLPQARLAYLQSFLDVYEGDPFLIRLLLQAGRFVVFHCAMVLESSHDLARRETWFTVAALKQQLAMFGYASARQVDHLLARLQEVGFHRTAPRARRRTRAAARYHGQASLASHRLAGGPLCAARDALSRA